jgi:hypothetical protein
VIQNGAKMPFFFFDNNGLGGLTGDERTPKLRNEATGTALASYGAKTNGRYNPTNCEASKRPSSAAVA